MNCPVCENTRMREVEKNGILIDVCPNCKGVWLDRGELEKLLEGVREIRQEFNEWYYGTPPQQPQPYPQSQPYPQQYPNPHLQQPYSQQPYAQQPYAQQPYAQQPPRPQPPGYPPHGYGYDGKYGYGYDGKYYEPKYKKYKKKSVLDLLGELFD